MRAYINNDTIEKRNMKKKNFLFIREIRRLFILLLLLISFGGLYSKTTESILKENNKQTSYIFIDNAVEGKDKFVQGFTPNDNSYSIISHGKPGELLIEGKWLNAKAIANTFEDKLKSCQSLYIYGCEFGERRSWAKCCCLSTK